MIELIGPICGVTFKGSWILHLRKTLGDQLAVAVDIGAPIDLDVRRSKARCPRPSVPG